MRTILFAALGGWLGVPAAYACTCLRQTPVQAAEATGIAYVGRVVAVPPTARAQGKLLEREVRVEVVDAIAGVDRGSVISLFVVVGSSASCGVEYPFTIGDEWVFFGTGDYRLTLCSPDRPADPETLYALHRAFP